MIKIFSFIGSCAGKQSRTLRYSDELAAAFTKKVEALGEQVQYESMTGDQLKINFCRSCNSCFKTGACPLAKTDDVETLKEKFLDADVIFFGSPVYLGDISGVARCVLDRISYWAHRFELAGKIVVVLVTASNNHAQETAERMRGFFDCMGAIIASSSWAFTNDGPPNIYLKEEMEPALDELSENLLNVLKNPAAKITDYHEKYWLIRKAMLKQAMAFQRFTGLKTWDEFLVCHDRGMENFKTYAEYFMSKFKVQI